MLIQLKSNGRMRLKPALPQYPQYDRLRDGFHDQHTGHDGEARKVSGKKWLVDGDILDRHHALLPRQIDYPIDQQKGISMRQYAQNVLNVELDVLGVGRFRSCYDLIHSV